MEKNLWSSLNQLQKTDPAMFLMRVESTTINGVPDVQACIQGQAFWLAPPYNCLIAETLTRN